MNSKKLSLLLIQFCLLMALSSWSGSTVYASEKKSSPLRIVVKVNDLDQISLVKEALINSLVDYNTYPELMGNIDYEASELKTASLNLTQTGVQKTAVQLVVKTAQKAADKTLFKGTVSATVEFEVRDLEAPVITSSQEVLYRSINAELNPMQCISVSDNYDTENVTLEYTTDYDNQTAGEYTITYTATDVYGNASSLTLPIHVAAQRYTNYGTDSTLIEEMLNMINEYRAVYGLEAYKLADANAQAAIGVRAAEARAFLSHSRPDGRHYKTAFNEYGVEYSDPYEILSFAGESVADKLAWWKQSEAHNARLLSKTSTTIAIGYCDGLWAAIVFED